MTERAGAIERLQNAVNRHTQASAELSAAAEELVASVAALEDVDQAFKRGKDVGRAVGWDSAKRDTSRALGLDGGPGDGEGQSDGQ